MHQCVVAGHGNIIEKEKIIIKPTTNKEATFYDEIEDHPLYIDFVPKCFKITTSSSRKNKQRKLIHLENLTTGYENPCIMDIKLGYRNHRDNADLKKILRSIYKSKISTSSKLGIRIAGYKYYSEFGNSKQFDKITCRHYKELELIQALYNFLRVKHTKKLIKNISKELNNIVKHLENNHEFRIYGGSVLLTYDNEDFDKYNVKLIDFSNYYVLGDDKQDDGYVYGLKMLSKILKHF